MKDSKLKQFIEIAYPMLQDVETASRHASFLVKRNKIISVGINHPMKTHPVAKVSGARFQTIHSELSAILRANKSSEFKNCTLINIRLSSDSYNTGKPILRKSKPCSSCMKLIMGCPQIREVFYTTNQGFEKL